MPTGVDFSFLSDTCDVGGDFMLRPLRLAVLDEQYPWALGRGFVILPSDHATTTNFT